MDSRAGRPERGMVKVRVTWETPDRDVSEGDSQEVATPLTVGQHVLVDIATAQHLRNIEILFA